MAEEKDFNVFATTDVGIFKGLNINKKCCLCKNFDKVANLSKETGISCISYGEDESEILVGLRSQMVKVFDVEEKSYSSVVKTEGGSGPLVGVARYEGALVTATQSGLVKLWRCDNEVEFNPIDSEVMSSGKLKKKDVDWTEEEKEKHAENLKIGRKLSRMRQSPFDKNLFCFGGQELDLQVWDLKNTKEPIFRAKNVRHDFLEMRVPVWISDVTFLSQNTVATCSRHGHIRKYDIKSVQRRPVAELAWTEKDEEMTCTAICAINENQVVVGTSTGKLGLWDFRKAAGYRGLIRKYKGCVGAVKSISHAGGDSEYFAVVGLDRYLRVFHVKGEKPLFNTYLKSKLSGVLVTPTFDPCAEMATTDAENEEENAGVVEDDDDDIVIEHDDFSKNQVGDDYRVSVADTRLENLLSLPASTYKDKSHVFYEFFKSTKKDRKILKTTDSEIDREKALNGLRQKFQDFQSAHSGGFVKPVKKRKLVT